MEPCGKPIPPGRAWPAPRSESCARSGQPTQRSVDSECSGPAIEPRNCLLVGALVVVISGGHAAPPQRPGGSGPAGVEEQGIGIPGFPRNLRDPIVSRSITVGVGLPSPKPQAPGRRRAVWERRTQARGRVSPSEGNEARREGRWGVGAPHSTVEPGEPYPKGPWGGKGAPGHRTVGGKHGRCIGT
jgi:hypothetical protein